MGNVIKTDKFERAKGIVKYAKLRGMVKEQHKDFIKDPTPILEDYQKKYAHAVNTIKKIEEALNTGQGGEDVLNEAKELLNNWEVVENDKD